MRASFCILLFITAVFVSAAHGQDSDSKALPQPKLISAPQPVYPRAAKDAAIGGRITVRVVVDETGAILSVDSPTGTARVCDSSETDPRVVALHNAVIESTKSAKFEPAMKDGKPVKSITYVSSTFDPAEQGPDPLPPGEKRIVRAAVLAGRAVSLPKPEYPKSARPSRARGAVSVQIIMDETGSVITATPVSGHPLLRDSAGVAACKAKFSPTLREGKPVRVVGVVTYVFVR